MWHPQIRAQILSLDLLIRHMARVTILFGGFTVKRGRGACDFEGKCAVKGNAWPLILAHRRLDRATNWVHEKTEEGGSTLVGRSSQNLKTWFKANVDCWCSLKYDSQEQWLGN